MNCEGYPETLTKKKESFKQVIKDLQETVKQEHYDSMTREQRDAMVLQVHYAMVGLIEEIEVVLKEKEGERQTLLEVLTFIQDQKDKMWDKYGRRTG